MPLLRTAKETLRQVLLSLRHQWYPKAQYRPPNANVRYRPPQKKNQAKTGFRKGYTISLPKNTSGQGSSNVPPANRPCWNYNKPSHWASTCPYPPSRMLRETFVRGVFTTLLWRKFLLVKWSPLVSFLLMITLQLCSLIRVLHIPL